MYGQFQYVRWGGREGARITTIHTKKEKDVYVGGGGRARITTILEKCGQKSKYWMGGWLGGTKYTNVNLWGQTTLVYYRGTENLSMYYRGTDNLSFYQTS